MRQTVNNKLAYPKYCARVKIAVYVLDGIRWYHMNVFIYLYIYIYIYIYNSGN